MPKDLDDIYKKIDQSQKETNKQNTELSKDQDKIIKDIVEIKKEVKNIAFKVDTMLEILNNFTIMLAEAEEEDLLEDYEDTDETWVPKEDNTFYFFDNDD
jgi:ethanolamine utilization cobalamin adenosyltransferase